MNSLYGIIQTKGDFIMAFHKGKISTLLYYTFAFLYVLYTVMFTIEENKFFIWVSILLVIVYLGLAVSSKDERSYRTRLQINFFANLAFIVLHYSLLGPGCGVQYIGFSLLPMLFYFVYVNEKKVDMARKASVLVLVLFLVLVIACSFVDYPILRMSVSATTQRILLSVNVALAFMFSIKFMLAFATKVIEDTGALENENVNLENTANIDALTGVRNRRTVEAHIEKALHQAVGEGKDFSVFMCDIDDFKKVNDTYGHDCGDQVLKHIATTLKNEIRPDDAIFRWGGEEFLLVINTGSYIAKKVAERCRNAIENSSVTYNDQEIKVTITIGGVSYYQGVTRDELINRADENLYEGKHNGKNQVVM